MSVSRLPRLLLQLHALTDNPMNITVTGNITVSVELFHQLAGLLSYILIYAVKLSMPILAAELITEVGVGIIMKAVPQINVFIVNLQVKVLLGFIVMLILVAPFASFLERMILLMFEKMDIIFQFVS